MIRLLAIFCAFFSFGFWLYLYFQQTKTPFDSPSAFVQSFQFEDKTEEQVRELNLESIFSQDKSRIDNLPQDKVITIIATGDVIPARSVNFQVVTRNNFNWPYEKTADILRDADLTFANLETPLINNCPTTQFGMIFCGDSKSIKGLVFAGIDLVSMANNHAGNFGEAGVLETINSLHQENIDVVGTNGPIYQVIKGVKFAFLGYNDITSPQPGVVDVDEELIKLEVSQAKQNSDFVIVTFHWGSEYQTQPDDRQKYLGHLTIDAGADLVIGNHPHWIQPIEMYKGKLITYAHGNFVFDQEWSQKTKEGVVGKYIFLGNKLIDVEYLPLQIDFYGQPHFVLDPQKSRILEEMKSASLVLSSNQ
jgi:hypothetical protein